MENEIRDITEESSIYNEAIRNEPRIGRNIIKGIAGLALVGSLLMIPSAIDNTSYNSKEKEVEQISSYRQMGDNDAANYLAKEVRGYIDLSRRNPENLSIPFSKIDELEAKLKIASDTQSTNAPENYRYLPGTEMVPFTKRGK